MLAHLEASSLSAREGRALKAAIPRDVRWYSSNWLLAGIARARRATSLPALDVIALLDGFLRWCHERDLTSGVDACLQIVQLELARRRHGAMPGVVVLPEPRRPGELTRSQRVGLVAHWEATSFSIALGDVGDERTTAKQLYASAIQLALHLAVADGVPIRLERLDTAAFAVALASEEVGAPPEGYETGILQGVATLYERAAQHGFVDPDVARGIAAELTTLALGYVASPSRAWAS